MDNSTQFIHKSNEYLLKVNTEASKIHFIGFKSAPLQTITRILYLQAAVYFFCYCREAGVPYLSYIFEAEGGTSGNLVYLSDSTAVAKRLLQGGTDADLKRLVFIIDRLILMNKSFVHGNHIYFKVEQALGVYFRQSSQPVSENDFNGTNFYLKLWVRTIFIIRQFQNPVIILHLYESYVYEAVRNGDLIQTREYKNVFA